MLHRNAYNHFTLHVQCPFDKNTRKKSSIVTNTCNWLSVGIIRVCIQEYTQYIHGKHKVRNIQNEISLQCYSNHRHSEVHRKLAQFLLRPSSRWKRKDRKLIKHVICKALKNGRVHKAIKYSSLLSTISRDKKPLQNNILSSLSG